MTFRPFCGVRADIDLRQIHFRDLGEDASMACPQCNTPLGVIEFGTEPRIRIELCMTCHGMFFNPGEVESLLDARTNPLVWLDPVQIQQIADDFGHQREVFYQKCPMCAERMSHVNFGGRSGVILDRCGIHGIWLEGGKLRRLTEWWRAGGKLIYQQDEADRAKRLYGSHEKRGTITSPEKPEAGTWSLPDTSIDPSILIDVIVSAASAIFED
ncbi:MAG: zf-TFIIB domain-containing protein [Verrucomicrobiota bacterium]